MINRLDSEAAVRPFEREVLQRLLLADAVLSLWAFVMDPTFLDGVFQRHRGRSFEKELKFPVFVELIADAGATSRKRAAVLRAALEHETLPISVSATYRKLGRVPLSLSAGFLEDSTARLRDLRFHATPVADSRRRPLCDPESSQKPL